MKFKFGFKASDELLKEPLFGFSVNLSRGFQMATKIYSALIAVKSSGRQFSLSFHLLFFKLQVSAF